MIGGVDSFGPETLDPIFSTGDTAATEAEARHFALLSEAIAERRVVRLVYRKAKHDSVTETRLIHPLHWFLRQDACQLIVHEPAIRAQRNFELVRIQEVTLANETFTWPADFELKRYLAGAFGRFVGYAQHAVHVVFDRDFVPLVRERPWQTGQVLIDRPDGSAETTYHVCHTADLEQQILRSNGQAEVIGPPEVRQRIRALALRFYERHA